MVSTFDRSGVRFKYPTNWALDVEPDGDGWTAHVQSPTTAFLMVTLRPELDTPETLAEEALTAVGEDYKELDAQEVIESFAGRPAVGHDIDFLTLDTPITCKTRSIDTPTGPMLVLCQFGAFEREAVEPVFQAIWASFEIEAD
jgi:hypothetical protein